MAVDAGRYRARDTVDVVAIVEGVTKILSVDRDTPEVVGCHCRAVGGQVNVGDEPFLLERNAAN